MCMTTIQYQISPVNPNSHLFDVTLSFDCQPNVPYTLTLPAWLPGSYMVRDFAKNIVEIQASNIQDEVVELTKIDKQSWSITPQDDKVIINYHVFAFDLSVRTAYLDNQRGFFNGSSTFLAVKELADSPCQLTINAPESKSNWRVATGMTRAIGTEKYSFGQYQASNYQELIDCPVAIGEFDSTEFIVEGVTHHVVFTSKHYGDTNRLANDLTKLCQHHINLFGEAPFSEYWFITHLLENGFGGLEHKNSTILQASRFDLASPAKPDELTDNYKTFLSLCSHEYFHAWNVCRIKPKELTPYNLSKEVYTEQLWAYEGITSYYDDFSLYRAGIIDFEDYLQLISKTATRVNRGTGQLKQSVSESSYYTWTKFYQQGADAPNNIVSYYTKGALIALWLDLTIREYSSGQYSLDNLMKELWIHFGRPGVGTQVDDFINIVNILCQHDLTGEINALLHDKAPIALTDKLANVGVAYQQVPFKSLNTIETADNTDVQPFIGALTKQLSIGVKVTQILEHSPAANAGLAVNDVIIAVDSLKASHKSLQALANHLPTAQMVSCHFLRDDQLITSEICFIDSPNNGVRLSLVDVEQAKKWQSH